jgi:hypothetical protein
LLLNPAGSGVIALIRTALVAAAAAGIVSWRTYATPLATDNGFGVNLLQGAAAGKLKMYSGTSAVALGSSFGGTLVAASNPLQPLAEWFHEVGEGEGVVVACAAVNVQLTTNFYWNERTS